jgi:hypothetical protein
LLAGGDGGRRSPELPLACFSFVMLAVRAGIGPGMTVPARYRGDEFVLLIVRNFSEPNFLGKKTFCL